MARAVCGRSAFVRPEDDIPLQSRPALVGLPDKEMRMPKLKLVSMVKAAG